jgi:hypothetical protein
VFWLASFCSPVASNTCTHAHSRPPRCLLVILSQGGVRSYLDVPASATLLLWAVFLPYPSHFDICQSALAASAIPLSLSLFQHISVVQGVGQLVVMIVVMTRDSRSFLVVFVVCMAGVGLCLRGVLHETKPFDTNWGSFVALCNLARRPFSW